MISTVKEEVSRAYSAMKVILDQCIRGKSEHKNKAKIWGRVYIAIGLPAAILAAVAGVSALVSTAGRIPAGIIAIISAGLGSAATFLNSQDRQQNHERLASEFEALFQECLGYLEFEVHHEEWLKNTFPQEIVHLRKRCAALLKDQPLKVNAE
jgi:hypothetical protein